MNNWNDKSRFTEIAEQAKKGIVYEHELSSLEPSAVIECFNRLRGAIGTEQRFYAGEFDRLNDLSSFSQLTRLPYEVCWVAINFTEPESMTIGFMCNRSSPSGDFQCDLYVRNLKTGNWFLITTAIFENGFIKFKNKYNANMETWLGAMFRALSCFLSALNCKNVRCVLHTPPEKLNKSRTKKRKTPLQSYKSLGVDLTRIEKSEAGDLNEKMDKRRVHLRRGHIRNHPTAGYLWIDEMVVGSKSKGIVTKDYYAREARER